MKKQKQQSINLYRKIALSFIILTFLLVMVILYFSFARATIIIFPAQENVSVNFIVNIEESADILELGTISGKLLETTVEGSEIFPVEGTIEVGTEVTGRVTIINNYNKSQPLVATTRLLTPEGDLFRIKNRVEVPAGGRVEGVEIYADDPESIIKEVGPTSFIIPGLWEGLQDKIYAESSEAMIRETTKLSALTQAEIDAAREVLQEKLFAQAILELNKTMKNGARVNEKAALKNVVSTQVDKEVGKEVDEFTLAMKLKVRAVAFEEKELLRIAQDELERRLPDDKELASLNTDNFTYSIEKYDATGGTASLRVYLEGKMVLKASSSILDKDKLVGLKASEVEAYLVGFESIEEATIKFTPFWIKKVPRLKDHIRMEIER